jgi:hypothetical protein
MDLFTPVVSEALQHPNFRSICTQQNGYNCDVLNEWARGFKDRDGKFVYEFQATFDTWFWELYAFAVLKQYGLRRWRARVGGSAGNVVTAGQVLRVSNAVSAMMT